MLVSQTSVLLRWIKPADNGVEIIKYKIYQKRVGLDNNWKQISQIYGNKREKLVENLEPGKIYNFIVTVTDKVGESQKDEDKKIAIEIAPAKQPDNNSK